jgi:hypothetical protein
MLIRYNFTNGRLVNADFGSRESHSDNNDYIDDYKKLKALLIRKYGEPEVDRIQWRNELYKNDPSRHGQAVIAGHLVYSAEWQRDRTIITTGLWGSKSRIYHFVIYQDKEAASKKKKEPKQEQRELDKI